MVRRYGWFVAVNMSFLLMIFLLVAGFHLGPLLGQKQIPWVRLLAFSAALGFGGALISLLLARRLALRSIHGRVIRKAVTDQERWLFTTIARLAHAADIGMPDIAVYESDSPNAFATGAHRDQALIAVSSGLLSTFTKEETEAVLAHEITHIASGDMVTLALLTGVLNTFVFFLARILGYAVDRLILNGRGRGVGYIGTVLLAQLLLGPIAMALVMAYSREREFRADAGAARITRPAQMVAALERLQALPPTIPQGLQAFSIHGGQVGRFFESHPPIEARIAALRLSPMGRVEPRFS
ncbi:MAG: protease HtpX [Acidiferrobacteraceae bacterium]